MHNGEALSNGNGGTTAITTKQPALHQLEPEWVRGSANASVGADNASEKRLADANAALSARRRNEKEQAEAAARLATLAKAKAYYEQLKQVGKMPCLPSYAFWRVRCMRVGLFSMLTRDCVNSPLA